MLDFSFKSHLHCSPISLVHLPFMSLSTSQTDCLCQQCVLPPLKIACVCHSHKSCRINTFVPILAALPLCHPCMRIGQLAKPSRHVS